MNVSVNAMPNTLEEFKNMPQIGMKKPEEVCMLFFCALNLYLKDKDSGIEALNILRGPRPMLPYDIQFLKDRFRGKEYLPLAYFNGATPQNNYTPAVPYVLEVMEDPRPQDIEEGYIRVFLKTAGADSPRPLKLRRKGDMWCLWEYSSILSGIRIPAEQDPWA